MFFRLFKGFHRSSTLQRIETFIIPQPGEGIAEVEIVQWLVSPNQKVSEFQILCEARSDKGFIEYKSPFAGTLKEVFYKPSDMAQIGSALYKIDVEGEIPQEPVKEQPPEEPTEVKSAPVFTQQTDPEPKPNLLNSKVLATPATRNLARQLNVDLNQVQGTGPNGRITKEDVQNFQSKASQKAGEDLARPAEVASVSLNPEDKILKLNPVQRAMVKSMTEALKIPHLTYCEDVYMDELISLRNQLKVNLKNVKLTFMPFFIKALSLSLLDFPIINSVLYEDKQEYALKASHNVSFAMDTPLGLIVPNIKSVQNKSIFEIAQDMARITDLGSKGKLTDSDLKDGTIALSNIGTIGGTYTAPVIMPPQVFIGALGSTRGVVEKRNGNFEERMVLKTSWSADHRLLDGATTARFVSRWKALLENPSLMLLHLK